MFRDSDFYVVRSDTGDGGWSIHYRPDEDDEGIAPVLVSGTAKWDAELNHGYGDWNAPTAQDIADAIGIMVSRARAQAGIPQTA